MQQMFVIGCDTLAKDKYCTQWSKHKQIYKHTYTYVCTFRDDTKYTDDNFPKKEN